MIIPAYLGDFDPASGIVYFTFYVKFDTGLADPTPTVGLSKNNDTGSIAVTLTRNVGGVTGRHLVTVNLATGAAGFYVAGSEFHLFLTDGNAGSVDLTGTVLAQFSIRKRSLESVRTVLAAVDTVVEGLPRGFPRNQTVPNFPIVMVSAVDHRTPLPALTVTAERAIDAGAFEACANAVTEVSGGAYRITLATADINGDLVLLRFTAPGADTLLLTLKPAPATA